MGLLAVSLERRIGLKLNCEKPRERGWQEFAGIGYPP